MPYLTCSSCGLPTYCVSEGTCPACGTRAARARARRSARARREPRRRGAREARDGLPRARRRRRAAVGDPRRPRARALGGGRGRLRGRRPCRCATRSASGCWTGGSARSWPTPRPSRRCASCPPCATPASAPTSACRSRPRTRAPTCCAAWRTRRGRTSGRPTCASCRAWPRACGRCSSRVKRGSPCSRPSWSPPAAAVARGAAATPEPREREPGAAVRLQKVGSFERAAVRHRAARRQARACSSSSRAARSGSSRAARSSTSRSSTSANVVTSGGEQRPAVDGLRARLRVERAVLRLLHRHERRRARRRVPAPQRRRGRSGLRPPGAPLPRLRAQPQRRPRCCSGPTSCSTSAPATAAAAATSTARSGNGQALGTLLGKILRIDPAPIRLAAVLGPARQPVRRPLRRRGPRSTATGCATRGGSRSTARPAT